MKELEEARRSELIGSGLQASVTLTPGNERISALLELFRGQLEDFFIVSKCQIDPESAEAAGTEAKLIARVKKAPGEKCVRCWHVRESVGQSEDHPEVCHVCCKQLERL